MSRWSSVAERFWERVNKAGPVIRPELGPCWQWTGGRTASAPFGYGITEINGRRTKTHRVSWELTHGALPPRDGHHGTCVLHRCDNRLCVNPDHLFLGTNLDNIRDRDAKGRHADFRGEKHPIARLTEDDVRAIRVTGNLQTRASLARQYGVTQTHIRHILLRKTWRHVA